MRKSCSGCIWLRNTHMPFKQSTFSPVFILHYQAEKFLCLINPVAQSSCFPLGRGERDLYWIDAFNRKLP